LGKQACSSLGFGLSGTFSIASRVVGLRLSRTQSRMVWKGPNYRALLLAS
jgi:hypothetical protein